MRSAGSNQMEKVTMNRMFVLLVSALIVPAAKAQAPTPPPERKLPVRPPVASLYCLPVSAGFLQSEAKASDEMKKCSAGDTIVVPSRSAGSVARMCDFSKSIVTIGENVVCTMVFPERASR
jgi:hypothetical protein